MAQASASIHIPVSADKVWALTGGFLSLNDWLPFIKKSEAQEGGRVRHLITDDGAEITERLQTYDNNARTYSYSIDKGPFPIKDYLATFKVKEDGADSTWVEWSGVFTADGVSDGEVEELFKGIYEGGLGALQANF
ncbi:polyketide cyclase/dehydrase/lipid transport protein [Pseudomonas graminis]|uniref:SRPBCC family protein n=1 Tax=Pseudomonas graminis TaxID=158627 RepID=UPI001061A4AB|nr:SRPBCC family protein [Pseudomonas graminis]TDV56698.1 polyketide cyclase/dehydrase/lipid transport protein [Pseudomonas graminis]